MTYVVLRGECEEVLPVLYEPNSFDAVVTDAPYGYKFMGKRWDYDVPSVDTWRCVLDVMKPGAWLVCFAGPRTYHRMAVNIEDAGFEIRDQIMWLYGSGFPKSRDAGKDHPDFEGWGTALKPAHEPIVLARKPLAGTMKNNLNLHFVGPLNIDGCRVPGRDRTEYGLSKSQRSQGSTYGAPSVSADFDASKGRWPANLLLTGIDEPWARYFYQPKATKKDRNEGVSLQEKQYSHDGRTKPIENAYQRNKSKAANHHPTVKPTDLMRYLCRLVTPPGGTILDPFAGSGSTGKAAATEGFGFVGIEREKEYVTIAKQRIEHAAR